MEHNLDQTVALLARTPTVLNTLLRELPTAWTESDEGDNTWTAKQVIAHLIHCERVDWLARVKRILEFGESKAFDPLDRAAHLMTNFDTPLPELLDEFALLRAANLQELRAMRIGPNELALKGKHPALGSLTLAELLAGWTVHDMTHLHQISRILAAQYREACGPFSAYLGVLKCDGHSG
jgi:DinB superfamily